MKYKIVRASHGHSGIEEVTFKWQDIFSNLGYLPSAVIAGSCFETTTANTLREVRLNG